MTATTATATNPLSAAFAAAASSLTAAGRALDLLTHALQAVAGRADAEAARVASLLATLPALPDGAADGPFAKVLGLDAAHAGLDAARRSLAGHAELLGVVSAVARTQAGQVGGVCEAMLAVARAPAVEAAAGESLRNAEAFEAAAPSAVVAPVDNLRNPQVIEPAPVAVREANVTAPAPEADPTAETPLDVFPERHGWFGGEPIPEAPAAPEDDAGYHDFAGWVEAEPAESPAENVTVAALSPAEPAEPAPLTPHKGRKPRGKRRAD